MTDYKKGVNLDVWETQRNTLYGTKDINIFSAWEPIEEFTELFKQLFSRRWSVSAVSQIKNGKIKFDRSEKDNEKMVFIAERIFHVPVWRLFNDEALVPLNGDGAEMFLCDLCNKKDTANNLRKTKDGRGRHSKCEAIYRRQYRDMKKELGMSTEVIRKLKKKRDALMPHMALTLEGLVDLKVNVLKILEYIKACEEPGLFLPVPGSNTSLITPAGIDYLIDRITEDMEKIKADARLI
jgi:hypothetical protein